MHIERGAPSTVAGNSRHWVIVVGGEPIDRRIRCQLPPGARVICADSGLDHAYDLGLVPTAVVGDLDSVTTTSLERARAEAVSIEAHPTDKDATDTELALTAALRSGATSVTLLGGGSRDRLDHSLGALLALTHPLLADLEYLDAWWGDAHLVIAHAPRTVRLDRPIGSTVSLMPLGGPCSGITTGGLRWELLDGALEAHSSRGLSNEVTGNPVSVTVRTGVLAIVEPGVR